MTTEINAERISEYLDSRDDFDLELFAYRALSEHGWPAHHGGTYTDPITSKWRQYDVRAMYHWDHRFVVSLAVECKSLSAEFPLVVSRVPRAPLDSYHDVIKCWRRTEIGDKAFAVETPDPSKLQLYGATQPVGKSITQVRWDKAGGGRMIASDSETHEKWSQALSSATEFVAKATTTCGNEGSAVYGFILPILIVSDHTLWVVDYSEEGVRETPKQVDETTLFVGREYPLDGRNGESCYRISHLQICTRRGFSQFLQSLTHPSGLVREKIFGFTVRNTRA